MTTPEGEAEGVNTFVVSFRDAKGKSAPDRKLHRLMQEVTAYNCSLGMNKFAEFHEYVDGLTYTVEQKFPYIPQDGRKRYEEKLERKGRTEAELTTICDVDRLIGRGEIWINNLLFTMPRSHRWNSCVRYLWRNVEDWCFVLYNLP